MNRNSTRGSNRRWWISGNVNYSGSRKTSLKVVKKLQTTDYSIKLKLLFFIWRSGAIALRCHFIYRSTQKYWAAAEEIGYWYEPHWRDKPIYWTKILNYIDVKDESITNLPQKIGKEGEEITKTLQNSTRAIEKRHEYVKMFKISR